MNASVMATGTMAKKKQKKRNRIVHMTAHVVRICRFYRYRYPRRRLWSSTATAGDDGVVRGATAWWCREQFPIGHASHVHSHSDAHIHVPVPGQVRVQDGAGAGWC